MKFDIDKRVTIYSTAWKVSKYGLISGPYFLVFSPNVMDPFSDPIQQCLDFLGGALKTEKAKLDLLRECRKLQYDVVW